MNDTVKRPIEILLVEDNEGDILLTQEAFAESNFFNILHVARDGEEVFELLRPATGAAAFRPDLILLDLNLPRMNGKEVLLQLKEDPDLRRIPVVIMTTSEAEEDVIKTYNLHANCYIRKPVDFTRFMDIVQAIQNFWFDIVTLPPKAGNER